MNAKLNDRKTCGADPPPRTASTREVVESAIEAAKTDNKQTWEQASEASEAMKWEESDCEEREIAGTTLRRKAR